MSAGNSPADTKLHAKCLCPGSWELRIGASVWSANYVPELRAWTAYSEADADLVLGPKETLGEIKDTLQAEFEI